jgi:hypothetical protein
VFQNVSGNFMMDSSRFAVSIQNSVFDRFGGRLVFGDGQWGTKQGTFVMRNVSVSQRDLCQDAESQIFRVHRAESVLFDRVTLTDNRACRHALVTVYDSGNFTVVHSNFDRQSSETTILDVVLTDFTVANSRFDGNRARDYGTVSFGGNQGRALTMREVFFRNCSSLEGAAIKVNDGGESGHRVSIGESRFFDNYATRHGGVLFATGRVALNVSGCLFRNNSAAEDGGVLFIGQPVPTVRVERCDFEDNWAGVRGPIARLFEARLTLVGVSVRNNTLDRRAQSGGGGGGSTQESGAFFASEGGNIIAVRDSCLCGQVQLTNDGPSDAPSFRCNYKDRGASVTVEGSTTATGLDSCTESAVEVANCTAVTCERQVPALQQNPATPVPSDFVPITLPPPASPPSGATTVLAPQSGDTANATSIDANVDQSSGATVPLGGIIGGAVGGACLLVCIVAAIAVAVRRRKNAAAAHEPSPAPSRTSNYGSIAEMETMRTLEDPAGADGAPVGFSSNYGKTALCSTGASPLEYTSVASVSRNARASVVYDSKFADAPVTSEYASPNSDPYGRSASPGPSSSDPYGRSASPGPTTYSSLPSAQDYGANGGSVEKKKRRTRSSCTSQEATSISARARSDSELRLS